MSGVQILEELKQLDYELWIRTAGYSHLTEEQWDWLIDNFKYLKKETDKRRGEWWSNDKRRT